MSRRILDSDPAYFRLANEIVGVEIVLGDRSRRVAPELPLAFRAPAPLFHGYVARQAA
ncbi:MAG: hypothetical protein HKN70_03110 [Gammaproteobacteria bacterium]|nr:hypothetical protein [Gammaproteobacteria bacterium]